MSSKVQLTGGAFQDAAGNLLVNGYLLMSLSQDGQVNGTTQVAAGVELKILLDQNGNVQTSPAQYVWPNDAISPANTFYLVSAYTAEGQLVWGPNSEQVLGPSPFDVGTWPVSGSNYLTGPVTTYDIGIFYPGTIPASALVLLVPLERGVRFSANLAPSSAACGTAATSTTVFTLKKNGTSFATLTFSNTGSPVYSSTGATFVSGDVLTVQAPSSPDATLADIGMILSGVVV